MQSLKGFKQVTYVIFQRFCIIGL